MPLDTSTYSLALLRLDGRRWNELRRLHGQISTQAAADGSSYLEMGNTKVMCTVSGPAELRRAAAGVAAGGGASGAQSGSSDDKATVQVDVSVAGFSATDRKKRSRGDKRTAEMQHTIASAFSSILFTHLYPRSTIQISLHILAQDGSVLAACINACTLALIDAGVPTSDFLVACTAGSTSAYASDEDVADPLLDLNGTEELELPFLTVGTLGATDKISVLVMETRVQVARIEGMLAVAIDGCNNVRQLLDSIVQRHGRKMVESTIA